MTAPLDLSQFKRPPQGNNPNSQMDVGKTQPQQTIDLSQFKRKEEKGLVEKALRVPMQFAIGAIENILWPFEVAGAVANYGLNKNFDPKVKATEELMDLVQKNAGKTEVNEEDRKKAQDIRELLKNPEKLREKYKPIDLSVRGAIKSFTGYETKPEGILEKGASFTGFINGLKQLPKVLKSGVKVADVSKALTPTKTELARGLTVGTALELAEDGEFGPMGTMAAVVATDLGTLGVKSLGKHVGPKVINAVKNPKETAAKVAAAFTPKDKIALQQQIIKDFRNAGIQADIGTITESNLLKMVQARLASSGLTGKALDDFRNNLTKQISTEYHNIADTLGKSRFNSTHEIGEYVRDVAKANRDIDLSATRELYKTAMGSLAEDAKVNSQALAKSIERIEKELAPGQIKSVEQQTVLNRINDLKKDIFDAEGNLKAASVKDLINNKIALNDIINYEVQGGTEQLLKGIVGDLDRAIISYGRANPKFAKNYVEANKRFSQHAKTFRNKNAQQILLTSDTSNIINKMNTVQGIREVEKILKGTAEGREAFQNIKRAKLDQVITNNMIDSTTQQAKLGTFSKLLEKGKNREIIREILGNQQFSKLERLQKNAGRLASSADKFYNASKSGTVAVDTAIAVKFLTDLGYIMSGNFWPLAKTGGGILATRAFSKLISDPKFLSLVEEAILATGQNSPARMQKIALEFKPYMNVYKEAINAQEKEQPQ